MKLITLKSDEIKNTIASEMSKQLNQHGFKYIKSHNEFRRSESEFVFMFNILQTAWSDHYSLDVRLYITQKRIQKILEAILNFKSHKITLGNDIGRIYGSPDGREVKNATLTILLIQKRRHCLGCRVFIELL